MGIRRTREQKESTQIKLLKVQYSYRAPVAAGATTATTSPGKKAQAKPSSSRDLFAYDVKLIFNDLKKTAIITVGILLLLVAITVYLKR